LSRLINATTAIAVATFLWYRKGRLWYFYDTLVSKCTAQISKDSIDRKKWEEIALEQCQQLSHEIFQSLFRFEVEYLKNYIEEHKYDFWIPDSEATTEYAIAYTDKEQFCRYRIAELFLADFRFCGLRLFLRALCWRFTTKKSRETAIPAGAAQKDAFDVELSTLSRSLRK